ncbi:unnamed protein product [Fusarium graminearum]|uniref:Chromosome 1, complete genome n=1 Tax=Gibberella zeae (strain ATCC MYA-4620 / CBS 123657 / FGSC 9075 / NRRL 31084 / PH-1) TaxID=229533 RepID=I1S043_GIBZE|nr:hypothetical protein FGSG_10058 [Fusarium graminearum PH-1]ESU16725.1 hypothetical protein FGSG_10058 [Fusarium graminearum PH-1]EYB22250.1 hypothetical protein FG05_10058 [Fusarium graminearum]CEF75395.1 unnamed protein product [Fusarium graminearum]CZS78676.1 unnamed protein product [Fusarium graminearum]|eukprot:XP_011318987.1 hypothetical protein FGSG_10058 [Fusarium graminearum PH-1]
MHLQGQGTDCLSGLGWAGLLVFASLYRDAACNEWDAGRVPGLAGEGLNGVIEHTGNTGLKNKMTVYVMLSNHEWYLLRIPPRQKGKIEIHDVQKTICHTK